MTTFASVCTGIGGVDIGAQQAGFELAWGIEIRPDIAEVANANLGGHVRVLDLLAANPYDFDKVDGIHASLPCIRASQANNSAELNEDGLRESPLDIALANKLIEFIRVLQPRMFTMENVWAYRKFQSWKGGRKTIGIEQALIECGYWPVMEHCNMADFSVPQTRKRMIVRAVRGGWVPRFPPAQPWVGWYSSIEDLLPTLPESKLAPWQLERLPAELATCMIGQNGYEGKIVTVDADEPAPTITANHNQLQLRAFLIGGSNTSSADAAPGVGISWPHEPAKCLTTNNVLGWRAVIIDGQNAGHLTGEPTVRRDLEPVFTITAGSGSKALPKALLEQGHVVAMTPRALARFQSFPNWYELPAGKTLAAYGIGNAVPPLFAKQMLEQLMEAA